MQLIIFVECTLLPMVYSWKTV